MDIIRNLQRLESNLAQRIDAATHRVAPWGSLEPLEIVHAIVDSVEKRVEPAGRGRYVFPFNQIQVSIATDSPETRARFEAVLGAEPTLRDRIVERLQASGCEGFPLSLSIVYPGSAELHWVTPLFHIEFERLDALPPSTVPLRENLRFTVVRGVSDKTDYLFGASVINIGRCAEVRDNKNRLIRTNHVIFTDNAEAPNMSVSRSHAHVAQSKSSSDYRLYDDQSAHGTSIIRDGKTIPVPSGPRGVRLQAGDDIVLGDACLHVELEERN